MFSCWRSVATLIAGCHSSRISSAISDESNTHNTAGRQPRITRWRPRPKMNQPSAAAAQAISIHSSHTGHRASSTRLPFENNAHGYFSRNSTMAGSPRDSMTHRVDQVIHPNSHAERGESFRILRIVGMLPRVAQIHVVAHGHHDPPLVVIDAAPARLVAIVLVGFAC